jgi:D-alanine-D-alanine ligase
MKTILVVFGGRSAEHDVSIITAHTPILDVIKTENEYEPYALYIGKDDRWYSDPKLLDMNFFTQPDYQEQLKRMQPVQLSFNGGLSLIFPGLRRREVKINLVFPSMHGTNGEDGSLMGLLRMANVPFVGCDMAASAVAMDKVLTKQVAEATGLEVVPYVWFNDDQWGKNHNDLRKDIDKLGYPLFVKPVHLGSSIAISRVTNKEELENAIEVALHYDTKVLVEKSVEDLIEITLPIMGNDELDLALPERPTGKAEFFNFEDKYLSGAKSDNSSQGYSELPAKLSPKLATAVEKLGRAAFEVVGCSGIARIDMLIDRKTETVYLNEINTLPGSLYAHNWRQAGVSANELVTKLIQLGDERFAQAQTKTVTFSSSILEQVDGNKTAQ